MFELFGFDPAPLPADVDLRRCIFSGALTEVYDRLEAAPSFGAETAMPPMPNLKSPQALRGWARQLWKNIAMHNRSWLLKDAQDAWKRIGVLPVAKTPQAMLADIISAGPGTKILGADKFYGAIGVMQKAVKASTKEPIIQSTAGAMAHAIAIAIATGKGHVAAGARAALAAPVPVAAEARGALQTIVQEAGAAQARVVDAAASVARMPGDVARSAIDGVTGVPRHLADQVADVAHDYLASARELAPQLAPFWAQAAKDLAGGAGRAADGVTTGVLVVGGLVVAGLGAVYAGPAIATAIATKRK